MLVGPGRQPSTRPGLRPPPPRRRSAKTAASLLHHTLLEALADEVGIQVLADEHHLGERQAGTEGGGAWATRRGYNVFRAQLKRETKLRASRRQVQSAHLGDALLALLPLAVRHALEQHVHALRAEQRGQGRMFQGFAYGGWVGWGFGGLRGGQASMWTSSRPGHQHCTHSLVDAGRRRARQGP